MHVVIIPLQGHHNSSSDLLAIHKELGFLIEFIKLNKEGFRYDHEAFLAALTNLHCRKILKKYDKKLKSSTGFGVFKQVEARLASEAVDIAFIQENTLVCPLFHDIHLCIYILYRNFM